MLSGQAYNDVLGLFDFWTILGGDTSTSDPVYAEHLYLHDFFRKSIFESFTDTLRLVEYYDRLLLEDNLMLTDYFIAANATEFEDTIFFNDIFDVGYYRSTQTIADNLDLHSYFTYFLVKPC